MPLRTGLLPGDWGEKATWFSLERELGRLIIVNCPGCACPRNLMDHHISVGGSVEPAFACGKCSWKGLILLLEWVE